jgi:DNA-binding response OmpR family regulator
MTNTKKYLENGSKSFDLGGVDYITKPFQHEEVMARVKTHVSLSRALMELKRKQV